MIDIDPASEGTASCKTFCHIKPCYGMQRPMA